MKRTLESLLGVICLTAVLSCDTFGTEEVHPEAGKRPVKINIGMPDGSAVSSRSAILAPEDRLGNINIYAYSDGILEESVYTEDSEDIIFYLIPGKEYRFYAIANTGEITPPEKESGLETYRYMIRSVSETSPVGLPMASIPQKSTVISPSADRIGINLVRLMARYTFSVNRDMLKHSMIEITSARIRQSASDIMPFAEESAATVTEDWDYATPSDISRLNAGESMEFYIPENCQGRLLPENTDQWAKVPDNIPSKKDVCTYLEVTARYTSIGLESDNLVYRMYLGEDTTTDFNIRRNSQNRVTLKVTDEGIYRASWMVDKGDLIDSRTLRFDVSSIDVTKGGKTETVEIICEPEDIDYTVRTYDFENGELNMTHSGNSIVLSSGQTTSGMHTARMCLYSWDGKLFDQCDIRVVDKTGYLCVESATGKIALRDGPHGKEVDYETFLQQYTDYKVCYNYLGGTNICNYKVETSLNNLKVTLGQTGDRWDIANAAFIKGSPVRVISIYSDGDITPYTIEGNNGTGYCNYMDIYRQWELTDDTKPSGGLYKTNPWMYTGLVKFPDFGIGKIMAYPGFLAEKAFVYKWFLDRNNTFKKLQLVMHLGFVYDSDTNGGAFSAEKFNEKKQELMILTFRIEGNPGNPYMTTMTTVVPDDEESFYHIPQP